VLRSRYDLFPSNIERIEISTYAKALEVAGNRDPRTVFEAQFSLPYCVGVALATGSARLEAFTSDRLQDPVVRGLMARTELSVDPQADSVYPGQRAATVIVHTRDGRALRFHSPTRKGDPDNPLSDEELSDKFMELVAPITGTTVAHDLLAVLWDISSLPDLAALPLPSP
jgi:2-methylcitrate dehydratase PrpD